MSLPSRECGLKLFQFCNSRHFTSVTPFAGVWIEIILVLLLPAQSSVTPFAGVWIEILSMILSSSIFIVTPFAGVWIEMH